ncbi:beta-ketoacyl-[acyl-carrier-protein] synthase family protein [Leucobacter salsicius]|uniref:beta-ketoacyl-[acyl-carrier-protein] synthase family protein n=1 Tax=Leucobacter salsicius TaxID=664638 RepID=UPI00034D9FF0|nr:beta-ketoacyl-[acyl-carrier-protein] synthase family protein [Leucobacter salsicius]
MNGERVVITGLGAITPSGQSAESLWSAVREGHSAITELDGAQFADLAVRIGGQIRGFDGASQVGAQLARRISPVQQWAIAAADEALTQAGIAQPLEQAEGVPAEFGTASNLDLQRIAVIAATGSGPIDAIQAATRALDASGPRAVPLTLSMHGAPDSAAALISQRYGFQGPAQGVSATCASGAIGLGEALRRIRHGYADAVLVVGMEDCLNPVNLASNANLRALAAGFEDRPAAASRPFDRDRAGFVMSQGAAAILVESASSARQRGARVLAELAGFGASSDAHHPTAPHPEGRGAAQAIAACLADAEVAPVDIDHINAHGTGTPAGDAAELRAFEAALGERAREIPISATKSSTGHLLGAAGVVEALISVMVLRDGAMPPTINLDTPAEPGWNFVSGQARALAEAHERPTVLSTSFGFGGHNGAVLLREWREDSMAKGHNGIEVRRVSEKHRAAKENSA